VKNSRDLVRISKFLGVISEPHRLKILYLLKGGEKCVCEIRPELDIPKNLLSHHLKVLKDFGLLASRKTGLNVYYRLDLAQLNRHRQFFAAIFKMDK
jgi:ArsR family transcriptional regulator